MANVWPKTLTTECSKCGDIVNWGNFMAAESSRKEDGSSYVSCNKCMPTVPPRPNFAKLYTNEYEAIKVIGSLHKLLTHQQYLEKYNG